LGVVIYRFHHVAGGLEARVDHVKSECSSRRVSSNKENINSDKAEMPKLSVEPLHMKRKKRSGGCNLRKSLAWDRAFSTEEGVLDPLELSLLSGSLVKTRGETLFTINEEERNPTSNDSLHDASSVYLSSNKKSTFKGIRAVALKEENRKASTKIPASHNGRTISKSSSCSRPLSSASYPYTCQIYLKFNYFQVVSFLFCYIWSLYR
ncbi:hypothetical protein EJD97_022302, partial [Solanum chilense]